MFCRNCGTQVKEGAAFCGNCGAAVAVPVQTGTPIERMIGRKKRKTVPFIIAGAAAVVIVIIVVVAASGGGQTSNLSAANPLVNSSWVCDDESVELGGISLGNIGSFHFGPDTYVYTFVNKLMGATTATVTETGTYTLSGGTITFTPVDKGASVFGAELSAGPSTAEAYSGVLAGSALLVRGETYKRQR